MNVLIYGAGVIGSIFAGKLALAGHAVTVLARGNRYTEIRENGIVLVDPQTNKPERARVSVIETLAPSMEFDYIVVAVQKTQIDDILPVLSQNSSRNIVFAVNTASGYAAWADAVGPERLMLGFPSAGGERKDGAVHYFIGKGVLRAFQTTTFGEYSGVKTERVRVLVRAFCGAGIPSVFCGDMDAWQKTHVAMVTCIADALYGFDCDNYRLGRSYAGVRDMVSAIQEGRQVLRSLGVGPVPFKLWWLDMPASILAAFFAAFMRTALAETAMAKHCIAAEPEMIVLRREFDVLIAKSGISTPSIDKLREKIRKTGNLSPSGEL